jgi:hypothetical protein
MPFGKHKGKKMIDVPDNWFTWYLANGSPGNVMEYAIKNKNAFEPVTTTTPKVSYSNSEEIQVLEKEEERPFNIQSLKEYAAKRFIIKIDENTIRHLNEADLELIDLVATCVRNNETVAIVAGRKGYKYIIIKP